MATPSSDASDPGPAARPWWNDPYVLVVGLIAAAGLLGALLGPLVLGGLPE